MSRDSAVGIFQNKTKTYPQLCQTKNSSIDSMFSLSFLISLTLNCANWTTHRSQWVVDWGARRCINNVFRTFTSSATTPTTLQGLFPKLGHMYRMGVSTLRSRERTSKHDTHRMHDQTGDSLSYPNQNTFLSITSAVSKSRDPILPWVFPRSCTYQERAFYWVQKSAFWIAVLLQNNTSYYSWEQDLQHFVTLLYQKGFRKRAYVSLAAPRSL